MLLGDRYGWVPPVERARAAAEEEGFDSDIAGRSVTDLEIDYGVLSDPEQQPRSMFYFRKPLPYEEMPQEVAAFYSDASDTDPAAADRVKRLSTLKRRIEQQLPGRVRHYSVDWDDEHERITNLESFGRHILEDVWAQLKEEAPAEIQEDFPWQEVERVAIEGFIEDRARDFVGRGRLLAQLTSHATSETKEDGAWGICLTGASGTGKSAIFGELARRLATLDVVLLAHATAASPISPSVDLMLRRWVGELSAQLGMDIDVPANAGPDTIDALFQSLLGRVASQRRVVALVDAADQFEATMRGRFVTWLPRPWPLNARFIVTAVPGEVTQAILKRSGVEMLPIPPLDAEEARRIAESICARYHRKLEPAVLDALIKKKGPDRSAWEIPLWLVLAAEELNLLDADDFSRAKRTYPGNPAEQLNAFMVDMVAAMSPDILNLYSATFDRAEELFGPSLTRAFLGSIAVSRAGWREADFRSLLPRLSGQAWDGLRFASLRRLFRGQIRQRNALGQSDFTHRLMRTAVKRRLETLAIAEVELHAKIAEYLLSLTREDPLRQTEAMVHLLGSQDWPKAASFFGDPSLNQEELNGATLVLADSVLTSRDSDDVARVQPLIRLLDAADDTAPGKVMAGTDISFNIASRLLIALNQVIEKRATLENLATLNMRILTSLQRCAKADPSEVAQIFLSKSHHNLGNVLRDQGDLAAALENYSVALRIRDQLAKADPADTAWALLTFLQDCIGDVLVEQGDLAAALDSYKAALVIRDRLAKADPSAKAQQLPSVSLNKIGDVFRLQGNLAAALDNYKASLAIRERLVKADFSNRDAQRDLSVAQEQVGDMFLSQGNLSAALDNFEAALAITDHLARADPTDTIAQRDLTVALNKVGDVLLAQGNSSAALDRYKAAHDIRDQLAKADPGNAKWQRDVSVSRLKIGDASRAQGNLPAALDDYRAALAITGYLSEGDPGNARWQRDLSLLHNKIAEVLRDQGDLPGALQSHDAAITILNSLVKANPSNEEAQRDLSVAHDKIGDVFNMLIRSQDALDSYRTGLTSLEKLVAANPSLADLQADVARRHVKIALLLVAAKRLEEALTHFRLCETIFDSLVASYLTDSHWKRALSDICYRLGDVLIAIGKVEEGIAAYQKDLAIAEKLASAEPGNADLQWELSLSYNKLGLVLAAIGKPEQALARFRQRLAILERLVIANPGIAQSQRDLALVYDKIGDMLAALGRRDEAVGAYEASISIRKRLSALDNDAATTNAGSLR